MERISCFPLVITKENEKSVARIPSDPLSLRFCFSVDSFFPHRHAYWRGSGSRNPRVLVGSPYFFSWNLVGLGA